MTNHSLPTVVILSQQEKIKLESKGIVLEKKYELPAEAYFVIKTSYGADGRPVKSYLMSDEINKELV